MGPVIGHAARNLPSCKVAPTFAARRSPVEGPPYRNNPGSPACSHTVQTMSRRHTKAIFPEGGLP